MNEIYKKLLKVQARLKAPKGQYNSFGKYHYRNLEDILESVKPLLEEVGATIILSDDIRQVGDRFYVEATASFIDVETGEIIYNKALAREEDNKKGMDGSQLTGSCSSYARKYALGGLLACDDNKDADTANRQDEGKPEGQGQTQGQSHSYKLSTAQIRRLLALANKAGYSEEKVKASVKTKYGIDIAELNKMQYDHICRAYEEIAKGA